jgi:hypothetical protein
MAIALFDFHLRNVVIEYGDLGEARVREISNLVVLQVYIFYPKLLIFKIKYLTVICRYLDQLLSAFNDFLSAFY